MSDAGGRMPPNRAVLHDLSGRLGYTTKVGRDAPVWHRHPCLWVKHRQKCLRHLGPQHSHPAGKVALLSILYFHCVKTGGPGNRKVDCVCRHPARCLACGQLASRLGGPFGRYARPPKPEINPPRHAS